MLETIDKFGLALKVDENAPVFLEILHESDGRTVLLLDGYPRFGALVDVLEQGLLPLNEGVAHLGEHLFLKGDVVVLFFVVPSHGLMRFRVR